MKVFSSVLVSLFFFSVAAAVANATIPEDASSGPGRRRKLAKKTFSPTPSQSCSYTTKETCKNASGCQWAPTGDPTDTSDICIAANFDA